MHLQFQTGHVQQYLRYLKDLVLRQRDVLERAKQELIAYKELQRCVRRCMAAPFCVCTRYMACLKAHKHRIAFLRAVYPGNCS